MGKPEIISAPGEDAKSVRFTSDEGKVVTFDFIGEQPVNTPGTVRTRLRHPDLYRRACIAVVQP
jgi:hypothetical protein